MILHVINHFRPRRQEPYIEAALQLAHQLIEKNSNFNAQAVHARGWRVVPLVMGVPESDQNEFLQAARVQNTQFIEIDLDMRPLTCSVSSWTRETMEEIRTTNSYQLRISCSYQFAVLTQDFELSFVAGPHEFLEKCLRSGVTKTWQNFLAYASSPSWPPSAQKNFKRLAHIFGAPQTIEEFTYIEREAYAPASPAAIDHALARAQDAVEAPGGFRPDFLKRNGWEVVPSFFDPGLLDSKLLCSLAQDATNLTVVTLQRGEPVDVLSIPLDDDVLRRLFHKGYHDQMLVFPSSEKWFFLKNNISCHIMAAEPAVAEACAQEFNTSWQFFRDNKNNFDRTPETRSQYNDLGLRYAVPDWQPFKEGEDEDQRSGSPRPSFLRRIINMF